MIATAAHSIHVHHDIALPAMDYVPNTRQTVRDTASTGNEAAIGLKRALRAAAARQIWAGFVLLLIGLAITGISMELAPGGFFVVTYGAIVIGAARMVAGLWKFVTC